MTLNEIVNALTRMTARPDVPLDCPVFIEGKEDEDEADRVFFLPDSQRIYITRKGNSP
jgi:hypothetical protein